MTNREGKFGPIHEALGESSKSNMIFKRSEIMDSLGSKDNSKGDHELVKYDDRFERAKPVS